LYAARMDRRGIASLGTPSLTAERNHLPNTPHISTSHQDRTVMKLTPRLSRHGSPRHPPLFAESPFEREMKQLKGQRDAGRGGSHQGTGRAFIARPWNRCCNEPPRPGMRLGRRRFKAELLALGSLRELPPAARDPPAPVPHSPRRCSADGNVTDASQGRWLFQLQGRWHVRTRPRAAPKCRTSSEDGQRTGRRSRWSGLMETLYEFDLPIKGGKT